MNTFYSIFSVVLNPNTSEKISVGLLLSNGYQSIFDYSPDKLNMLRPTMSKDQYFFIKNYFRSVNHVIEKIDKSILQLSFKEEGKNAILSEPYFDYLSTYNRNVITVSRPVRIDLDVKKEIFIELFEKYIGEDKTNTPRKEHTVESIKKRLIPAVEQFFSVDIEFTPSDHTHSHFPVKIDLIGQNHQPVISQFLDLERNLFYLKSDYFDLEIIPEFFPESQRFLISAEPDKKKFGVQHDLWKEIRKYKFFDYVDASEAENMIREYAMAHDVKPYEA